jgi:hypothetical protein
MPRDAPHYCCTIAIIVLLSLLMLPFIEAFPLQPNEYYGSVRFNGSFVSPGTIITAKDSD